MIGKKLKFLRSKTGLSQLETAKKLTMARSTYACYENDTRSPEYDVLKKLANYHDVSTDYLLGYTEEHAIKYTKQIERVLEKHGYNDMTEEEIKEVSEILGDAIELFKIKKNRDK